MENSELHTAAKEIAEKANVLLSDELGIDFAAEYNEIVSDYIEDYSFENETAKGLFSTAVNFEFANMSNYRKVFPQIIYK